MDPTDISSKHDEDGLTELCFPSCDDKLKPHVGNFFFNLDEAYNFYEAYAATCGFQARKSTIVRAQDGTIQTRYVVCNREGSRKKPGSLLILDTNVASHKRKRPSHRIDCMARIVLEIASGGRYMVRTFNEGHNHTMIPQESWYLMTKNRSVDDVYQLFILTGIKANIGPMRTFRFYKEIVGSYESVGCRINDFKNFARDLRVYLSGSDAHMFLEEFKNKQQHCNIFKYFYDVDEENKLRCLFWDDEIAIRNFTLFGEAVSFDTTYNTNRYKLIFTPFTGRDNHNKCVSFGAAIISREDMDAYSWVLEKFMECMGSAPTLLITDQEPGLRKTVASIWPTTSHRFCMWHITMKVAEKLPVRLRDDVDFKIEFGKIVWSDYDDPNVFEEKWDISMSGLFRTTSLSESENSYFKRFLNKNSDLLVLCMNYCSAMDAQRHTYHKTTLADETGVPVLVTKLSLERHAANVYSSTIFKEVQMEIESSLVECYMSRMYASGDDTIYVIGDNMDGTFEVWYESSKDYFSCACKLFTRKGMLCKHIWLVMQNRQLYKIPEKYIAPRWSKLSILAPQDACVLVLGGSSQTATLGNRRFFALLTKTLARVNGNQEVSDRLFDELTEVSNRYVDVGLPSGGRHNTFENFFGQPIPEVPNILSPDIAKTKGSGAGGGRNLSRKRPKF